MAKSRLLTVHDALRLEFEQAGFAVRSCETYRIDTAESGATKRKLYAYMLLVTEYVLGPDVPAAHLDELRAWLDDPGSSHSIHMFAMVLQRSGEKRGEASDGMV
jgi:hypothetical protein